MNKPIAVTALQVRAAREGGSVERCHGTPHVGSYSVASHTFGALSLLLLLHPAPSLALIRDVTFHDVAERWLGDVPSPGKRLDPELAKKYDELERRLLFQLGLGRRLSDCSPDDENWLVAVDILDLWLWTREQLTFGNRNVLHMSSSCLDVIELRRKLGKFPDEAWAFFEASMREAGERLPDYWPEIEERLRVALDPTSS